MRMSIADRLRLVAAALSEPKDRELADLVRAAANKLDEQTSFQSRMAAIASLHGVEVHDVAIRLEEFLISLEEASIPSAEVGAHRQD